MNIAYIIPKLADKAPILVVLELVKKMMEHKHRCVVYYFDRGEEVTFPCRTQRILFREKIDFDRYDIVHTHGLRPDLYVYFHASSKWKTKFVTTLHSYVIPDLQSQYNKIVAYSVGNLWLHCLCKHHQIVVLSQAAVHYYRKWFELSKLSWAYNTREIDMTDTLPKKISDKILSFKGKSLLIGINALLSPIKGIDQLIRCLPYLPDYKLFIAGDGKSKDDLQNLAKTMGVENRCYFIGYLRNAYRLLPYYDIYAMPSYSEGFPLVLLEAAIYKKNVICSDIPIFRELYTENEVSFFKVGNKNSLVESIKKSVLKDKGNAIYQKYLTAYSPECFYQKYVSIYTSLLKNR